MRERAIETYLSERVRQAGGRAYKWSSPGRRGVPDRLVLMPGGRCYGVELKSERGEGAKGGGRMPVAIKGGRGIACRRLSPLQRKMLSELTALGLECFVLESRCEVDAFIDKIVLDASRVDC